MRSFRIFSLMAFSLLMLVSAREKGIQFDTISFFEAGQKSQASEKIIFLDAYASWCGPCKRMTENVFPDAQVGKFYNKNFINLKIDMEKGEGVDLSKKLKITAYPTLIFFSPKGRELFRAVGYHTARELLGLGKKIKRLHKKNSEESIP